MPIITPKSPTTPGPFVTIPAFLYSSSPRNNIFWLVILSPVDPVQKASPRRVILQLQSEDGSNTIAAMPKYAYAILVAAAPLRLPPFLVTRQNTATPICATPP